MRSYRSICWLLLSCCGRYGDFKLPTPASAPASASIEWIPRPAPVLPRGAPGDWDSHDALNPSVIVFHRSYMNLYSGFDGKTWTTGLATSDDGIQWTKHGKVLSPDPNTWEGDGMAANGAVIENSGRLMYFYQAGIVSQIGLAFSSDGRNWSRHGSPVLGAGPRGSWDERGVGDPYVIRATDKLYLFYLGMDRARRQRLGVAVSDDGVTWTKLRSNPILELGGYGAFDENGLGESAVWDSRGYYWMLYTGRDHDEHRRLGLARSRDGVQWEKLPHVFAGDQPWDTKVICDPTVLLTESGVNVWFGGGDVAHPVENIDGQIGFATLKQ